MSRARFFWATVAAFGAIAFTMVWYASNHGIGLLPDSMSYLEAGRSLLREHRFLVDEAPMIHFPPLYPLLLAGAGLPGGDLLASTRLLHCLIFGLTVGAVGGAVWQASRRSLAASSLAMSCTLAVAGIVQIHATALSEPAFLCLLVAGSLALDRYLREHDHRWLVTAAMVAAAAGLTRYAGVCLVFSMLAAVLILDRQVIRARLRSAAVFAAVSCAPLVLWTIRNAAAQGSAVDRSLAFHPPDAEALRTLAYTLSFWAWPTPNLPPVVRAGTAVAMATVLAATVVIAVGRWFRRYRNGSEPCFLHGILAIFALSYGPFLLTSRTFVDAHTNFDNRILSPILIACIVLAFARSPWPSGPPLGIPRTLLAATWVAVAVLNIPWTAHILIEGHAKGIGYASEEWRESEVLAFVNSLPPATAVYSNAPEVIRVLLDRPATMMPRSFSPASRRSNPGFDRELKRMMERLASEGAVLAFFDRMRSRDYLPTPVELIQSHGLDELFRASDGAVFNRRSSAASERRSTAPDPVGGP